MKPKLSSLILSVPRRLDALERLLSHLSERASNYPGEVEIIVCLDNGELSIGQKRQQALEAASGEYVAFIDDDDWVPDYYFDRIMPLLDGVDYVGFRLQLYEDGVASKPTFHSLRHASWFDDEHGYYRHISHLNPLRRELALRAPFDGGCGEDARWASAIWAQNCVATEHFIDEVMYEYRHSREGSVSIRYVPMEHPPPLGLVYPHVRLLGGWAVSEGSDQR